MKAQVHVVPNVVNTDLFRPAAPALLAGVPVGATRRRMRSRGMERLLHVSSLNDDQKNITGLLSALRACMAKNEALKATFVGGEKAALGTFKAWVVEHGLEQRITFTGPLDAQGVVKHMQDHDVLVLNSRQENFPCVIPEAWACGIPVMSTDVGGIWEHLPEGERPRIPPPTEATDKDWEHAWTPCKAQPGTRGPSSHGRDVLQHGGRRCRV